jgi:hypothetical protein
MALRLTHLWHLRLGLAALFIGLFLTAVVGVKGNAGHFLSGLFMGLGIVFLLVGIYKKNHVRQA